MRRPGETDASKHMDLAHFLDAAHGEEFSHQTMETQRRLAKPKAVDPSLPVPEAESIRLDPTNFVVMWLIQLEVFASYWCNVARNMAIGVCHTSPSSVAERVRWRGPPGHRGHASEGPTHRDTPRKWGQVTRRNHWTTGTFRAHLYPEGARSTSHGNPGRSTNVAGNHSADDLCGRARAPS